MARIIVNADDFGLTPGINTAIRKLFEAGLITGTSALVCGRYIEEGIGKLPREYHSHVGLHICLDEERPLSDPKKIPTLVNFKTGFFKDRLKFIQDLFLHRISLRDLYFEIKAQFEKLFNLGITPSHIDSHGHLHVLPYVSGIVDQLSKEYGISQIRKPVESFWPSLITFSNIKRLPISLFISYVAMHTFKKYYKTNREPISFIGLLDSGQVENITIERWVKIINKHNHRIVEIMFHPGIENDREIDNYRHWKYNWRIEYKALSHLKDIIETDGNIEMVSFKKLKG